MGIEGAIYAIELLVPIVCIAVPIMLMALGTEGEESWDDDYGF